MRSQSVSPGLFSLPVLVGALGFFVDIFDLLLFSIIRKPSLQSLQLSPEEVLHSGELIISMQMIGLTIGGIFWGIMGDKKGRLSVLFGSILLYSLASIANGMVQTVPQYVLVRFIAGVGLAGELGASVTLVTEMLPKDKRGIGATIIATTGVCGALVAYLVYDFFKDWRLCYYIGGALGFLLLLLRANMFESGLYATVKETTTPRGDFRMIISNRSRFIRYLRGILIGFPVWFVIGVLITFSDQFGKEMGIMGVDPARAIFYQYIAIGLGDISAGLLSNYLKSRKKALWIFYSILVVSILLYFSQGFGWGSLTSMYWICAFMGFGSGISVLYITMSAEQFGTNLRATTAISIPNVVRGLLPLIILLQKLLQSVTKSYLHAGMICAVLVLSVAIWALVRTRETYGRDMDFLES
ncbi:MAG: MFS transporter [Chitinophagia bacterium]|jgi:MFS family permease|nr:MFS transporter [Chitinophagia bacterium]